MNWLKVYCIFIGIVMIPFVVAVVLHEGNPKPLLISEQVARHCQSRQDLSRVTGLMLGTFTSQTSSNSIAESYRGVELLFQQHLKRTEDLIGKVQASVLPGEQKLALLGQLEADRNWTSGFLPLIRPAAAQELERWHAQKLAEELGTVYSAPAPRVQK